MSPLPPNPRKQRSDAMNEMDRAAHDFADRLDADRLQAEIVRRLEEHCTSVASGRDGFHSVHVVDGTSGLPDTAEVALAILHPRHLHDPAEVRGPLAAPVATSAAAEHTRKLATSHGRRPRHHRNAVIALAADAHHYPALESSVREFLAWSHVATMAHALGLSQEAADQALVWREAAHHSVDGLLLETYFWLMVPHRAGEDEPLDIRVLTADGITGNLADRAALTLRTEGELIAARDDHAIRRDLDGPLTDRWRAGHISLGELWELYTTLPSLPRLRDRSVLEAGLVSAIADELDWQYQGFALADGYDQRKSSYLGLRLPGDDQPPDHMQESTLVVRPDRAVEQRHSDTARAALDRLDHIDHLDHVDRLDHGRPVAEPASGAPLTAAGILERSGRARDDVGRPIKADVR